MSKIPFKTVMYNEYDYFDRIQAQNTYFFKINCLKIVYEYKNWNKSL